MPASRLRTLFSMMHPFGRTCGSALSLCAYGQEGHSPASRLRSRPNPMHLDTGHRRNNFDALRIAAALMVLFGHGYVLSGLGDLEPVARTTGVGGFGEVGVSIFFVISGFLVSASWDRLPDFKAFMAARLLRIVPGLAVAVMLSAFVLGPLVSILPASGYFAAPQTWLYPLRNILLYPVTYALPGVFGGLPFPDVVNGSLWTLRLEFSCYLLTPVLWLFVRRRRSFALLAAAAAALLFAMCVAAGPRLPPMALIGARNLYLFLAGAALYAYRAEPWTRSWLSVAASGVTVVAAAFASRAWGPLVASLALPLLVVAFAQKPLARISSFSRYGDYSYGVYIYAFPVQQTLMLVFGPEIGVPAFVGLTLLCVAPLAAASWLLVEKPALDLKARFRSRARGA